MPVIDPSSIQLPDLLGGRYRLIRKIGVGGSSTVYEAVHHLTRERVAIKVISLHQTSKHESTIARFMREAVLSQKISHPGVVRVMDAWIEEEVHCCLVMELLNGESLRDAMSSGQFSRLQILRWLIEVLTPLDVAHQSQIIHRDLKPENIFIHHVNSTHQDTLVTHEPMYLDEVAGELRPIGTKKRHFRDDHFNEETLIDRTSIASQSLSRGNVQVKIVDFGLSRSSMDPSLTQTGYFVGTPWYMSPEQIKDSKTCDHRTDIWSIGIILYEILSGRVPFIADTFHEVCYQIVWFSPPRLDQINPEIPADLAAIVHACLEKAPEARYKNLSILKYQLEQLLEEGEEIPSLCEPLASNAFPTPSTLFSDASPLTDVLDEESITDSLADDAHTTDVTDPLDDVSSIEELSTDSSTQSEELVAAEETHDETQAEQRIDHATMPIVSLTAPSHLSSNQLKLDQLDTLKFDSDHLDDQESQALRSALLGYKELLDRRGDMDKSSEASSSLDHQLIQQQSPDEFIPLLSNNEGASKHSSQPPLEKTPQTQKSPPRAQIASQPPETMPSILEIKQVPESISPHQSTLKSTESLPLEQVNSTTQDQARSTPSNSADYLLQSNASPDEWPSASIDLTPIVNRVSDPNEDLSRTKTLDPLEGAATRIEMSWLWLIIGLFFSGLLIGLILREFSII